MDLFIPNIPRAGKHADVERALRAELHKPIFSPETPLNFRLFLFRDKRRRLTGKGLLSLPTEVAALHFLRFHSPVTVYGVRLFFSQSNKRPDHSVIHRLCTEPYRDRGAIEERDRIAATVEADSVPISALQFGWDCRDGTYSAEWEFKTNTQSDISFDLDFRRIVVSVNTSHKIHISFSQVSYLSAYQDEVLQEAIIFVNLATPPSFYTAYSSDDVPLSRLHALPLHDVSSRRLHERISPYLSYSIRLVCAQSSGPRKFRDLVKSAGLNVAIRQDYFACVRANLFSEAAFEHLHAWVWRLPFFYAIMVESLVRSGSVDPTELMTLKEDINQLITEGRMRGQKGREYVVIVLRDFEHRATNLFWDDSDSETTSSIRDCFLRCKRAYNDLSKTDVLTRRNDNGIFLCFHIIITPTQILYEGPHPERSNRVIRSFPPERHQNFIRVSFVEEGKLRLHYSRDYDFSSWLKKRVEANLKVRLPVAGRPFEFLGYSQSALKSHGVWFLRAFTQSDGQTVNVPYVINSLGSFSNLSFDSRLMYCPARYAARISQAFTTTEPSTTIVEDLSIIEDIKRRDSSETEWNFTDGVGTMSRAFAKAIHRERWRQKKGLGLEYSATLQIRFQGSKGMLSVDHTLTGMSVRLRPSMIKFSGADSNRIEIAQIFDKCGQFYLNRPLIMLLEGLGVPYEVFKGYQDAAVLSVNESTSSIARTNDFLAAHGLGASFRFSTTLLHLAKLGAADPNDDFYNNAIQYARTHALRELKHKSRIPIPNTWNLVGVADVHGVLDEREIFACIKCADGQIRFLEGSVLITRSPTIHPGDVQIARAIGRPTPGSCFDIEPLQNAVVFSTKGSRPLFTYLGGGDLDGDEYNVIPLDDHPGFRIQPYALPSAYAPAKRRELSRPCTHDDIAEFVADYIKSDNLGYISLTWRVLADLRGIYHPDCIRLADLHSQAVDFAKSGLAVNMKDVPERPVQLPDWHAPETMFELDTEKYYESQKAIGKLFRAIDLPAAMNVPIAARRQRDTTDDLLDSDVTNPFSASYARDNSRRTDRNPRSVYQVVCRQVLNHLPQDRRANITPALPDIRAIFLSYRYQLQSICTIHTLSRSRNAMLTEEEAFIGTIVANTSQPSKRIDHISKIREETAVLVDNVRESLMGNDDISLDQRLYRSYTVWYRSEVANSAGAKIFGLRSFGWIALSVIFETMKDMDERNINNLTRHMSHVVLSV